MNSRPPVKPTTVEPFKHVIDEYKHQAQTITCTCGWHGSSATLDRGGSSGRPTCSRSAAKALTPAGWSEAETNVPPIPSMSGRVLHAVMLDRGSGTDLFP